MANTSIRDALSVTTGPIKSNVRDAVEAEHAWVMPATMTPSDFTPNLTRVIVYGGRVFSRDDSDTTTPHDGVTTIVVAGGVRFKADGFGSGGIVRRFSVSQRVSTPPASPVVGQTVIVTAPGSGAFAGHVNDVATWTAAGWRFVVPKSYDEAHVSGEGLIYHFNASSTWVQGSPAIIISDNSILFTKLKHGLGLAVENITTDTPPPSPSNGVAYIIGGSPTGAWTGHAGKVAIYENSAWVIASPAIGWNVYDKSISGDVTYKATGWAASGGGYVDVATVFTAALFTSVNNLSSWTYSATTAPTTANDFEPDPVTLSFTAKKSGAILEITYDAELYFSNTTANDGGLGYVGLAVQVDGTSAFADWQIVQQLGSITSLQITVPGNTSTNLYHIRGRFFVTTTDALAHTYTIRIGINGGNIRPRLSRRRITIREVK